MVYAIQLTLTFRNVTRRNAAAQALNTRFELLARWGVTEVVAMRDGGDHPNMLVVNVRFASQADRDAVWAELDTRLGTGLNGPVVGSRGFTHDCAHDGSATPCVVANSRTW